MIYLRNTCDFVVQSVHLWPHRCQGALLTGLHRRRDAQSRWSRHRREDSERRLPLPSCLKRRRTTHHPQPQHTKPQHTKPQQTKPQPGANDLPILISTQLSQLPQLQHDVMMSFHVISVESSASCDATKMCRKRRPFLPKPDKQSGWTQRQPQRHLWESPRVAVPTAIERSCCMHWWRCCNSPPELHDTPEEMVMPPLSMCNRFHFNPVMKPSSWVTVGCSCQDGNWWRRWSAFCHIEVLDGATRPNPARYGQANWSSMFIDFFM